MNGWLEALCKKETERRSRVDAIYRLAPAFLDSLLDRMKHDITEFQKAFPQEQVNAVRMAPASPVIQVERLPRKQNEEIKAIVEINAQQFELSVRHIVGMNNGGRVFILSAANDALKLDNSPVDIEKLSRFILSPVLFPELFQDRALKGYFQI